MSYSVEQIIEKRRRLWDKHHDEGLDREFIRVAADEIVSSEDNRKVVRERPWLLIEACFTVVTKEGKTVPFFFNEVQRDFIRQIEENGASICRVGLPAGSVGCGQLHSADASVSAGSVHSFAGGICRGYDIVCLSGRFRPYAYRAGGYGNSFGV